MIVPMTKYGLILYHNDRDRIVDKLMDLGAVQICRTKNEKEPEQSSAIIREIEAAIKRFAHRKRNGHNTSQPSEIEFHSLEEIASMEQELERCWNEAEAVAMEIKLVEPWGDFDPGNVRRMEEATGLEVKFFAFPESRFEGKWMKDYPLQVISRRNNNVYFIILQKTGEKLPLIPMAMPDASLGELKRKREVFLNRATELNVQLDRYASGLANGLGYKLAEARDEVSLSRAKSNVLPLEESKMSVITLWCPVIVEPKLGAFLDREKIVFTRLTPDEGEIPPVLLRNNWFVRLFEPIGSMFSLPRYSELDLTIFFAPFFLLFFGLCLGDAGYGIVILLGATLFKLMGKKSYRDYLSLGQLFGASTIIAGVISGTFFGMEMRHHDAFTNWTNLFLDQDQLFQLAILIGFIQIQFALGIQVFKLWHFKGLKFALSRIGWIILLFSLADLYVAEFFVGVSRITVWVALGLIVFFGSPGKGWLRSFGFGLADLYNITGFLGDLLSYIRLFALGVSSSILGLVVNSIALSSRDTPYVGIVLYLTILVVGHTANLTLASLSAFVHPMRLTFVEFYKNSGFEGGGKPFVPFKRSTAKNIQS